MVAQWNVIYEHILNSRHSTRLIIVCSLHTNNIIDNPHTKVFFHEWQYDQNMVIHKNAQQCKKIKICNPCNVMQLHKKFESLGQQFQRKDLCFSRGSPWHYEDTDVWLAHSLELHVFISTSEVSKFVLTSRLIPHQIYVTWKLQVSHRPGRNQDFESQVNWIHSPST